MSLGTGVLYGTSRKHRMNMKISTESEIVLADDVLPQMLWALYFIEAQGYKIHDDILYQRQQKLHLVGDRWMRFKWKAYPPH